MRICRFLCVFFRLRQRSSLQNSCHLSPWIPTFVNKSEFWNPKKIWKKRLFSKWEKKLCLSRKEKKTQQIMAHFIWCPYLFFIRNKAKILWFLITYLKSRLKKPYSFTFFNSSAKIATLIGNSKITTSNSYNNSNVYISVSSNG